MTSRKLVLSYTAYVEVSLPNEVADRMESGELGFWDKWGVVHWQENGQDREVEGKVCDVDYKRSDSHYFEDNSEERRLAKWKETLAAVGKGGHWAIPATVVETEEPEPEYDYTELGAIPRLFVSEVETPATGKTLKTE